MSDHPMQTGYRSANFLKYTAVIRLYQLHIRAFQECLFELLKQADPDTILDAGCGEGFVVDYLVSRNPQLRITGVDVCDEAITYARHHFGDDAHFRTGNVYKLPFSDQSFDTVICSEVLEHLNEPG
jgi:2-polyprenyl-3-methyl-5-hydroxy-6-metoxy-1,4-benzoquinol methylase